MSKANKQTRVEEECVGISFIQKAYAISALFFPSIYSLCRHKCFIRSVQLVGWTQTMNENRYDEPTDQNDAYHWSVADSGVLIVAIIIKIKVISCFHNRHTIKFILTFFRVLWICAVCSERTFKCSYAFMCVVYSNFHRDIYHIKSKIKSASEQRQQQ